MLLLEMGPSTTVSSANLMMELELCGHAVMGVEGVESGGLSAQPCGAPVFSVMVLETQLPALTACGLFVRKLRTQAPRRLFSPRSLSLPNSIRADNSIES